MTNPSGGTFGTSSAPPWKPSWEPRHWPRTPRGAELHLEAAAAVHRKALPLLVNMKFAADREGKLLAMETDYSVDHGPYSEFGDL